MIRFIFLFPAIALSASIHPAGPTSQATGASAKNESPRPARQGADSCLDVPEGWTPIYNQTHLENAAAGSYRLCRDLTLKDFQQIHQFTGILDGQNHELRVENVIYATFPTAGVFNQLQGEVRDLRVRYVSENPDARSGLVALIGLNATVSNVHVSSDHELHVPDFKSSGGFFRFAFDTSIHRSSAILNGSAGRGSTVGGMIGNCSAGVCSITESKVEIHFSGTPDNSYDSSVGGFIGRVFEAEGRIENSYSTGTLSTLNRAASLVAIGENNPSLTILNTFTEFSYLNSEKCGTFIQPIFQSIETMGLVFRGDLADQHTCQEEFFSGQGVHPPLFFSFEFYDRFFSYDISFESSDESTIWKHPDPDFSAPPRLAWELN